MLVALAEVTGHHCGRTTRLVLDINGKRELMVNGIEGRLVQVFRNLIANALVVQPARRQDNAQGRGGERDGGGPGSG